MPTLKGRPVLSLTHNIDPPSQGHSAALTHARATAVAKGNSFCKRHNFVPFKTWDEVEEHSKITVPITIRGLDLTYMSLKTLATWYVEDTERRIGVALETAKKANEAVATPAWKKDEETGEGGLLPFNLNSPPFRPVPRQRKAYTQIVRELGLDTTTWPTPRSHAALIPLPGGEGKTAIAAMVIKHYQANNYFGHGDFPIDVIFCITPKRVKEKFRRFLTDAGVADVGMKVCVASYNELGSIKWRSRFKQTIDINPIDQQPIKGYKYAFAPLYPALVIIDESHLIKKPTTKRTKLVNSLIGPYTRVIYMSATSAVIPNDLFNFAIASRKPWGDRIITKQNWKEVAWAIGDSDPKKSNGAAMERFAKFFGDSIVKPPADPRKVKCYNAIKLVKFVSEESQTRYREAEAAYIEACERLGKVVEEKMNLLAKFMIFRRAEEREKAPVFGQLAIEEWLNGRSPIVAVSFIDTAKRVFEYITRQINPTTGLNFTRDDVSVIWGGAKLITADQCFSLHEFQSLVEQVAKSDEGEKCLDKKTLAKYRRTRVFMQERWAAKESQEEQSFRVDWLKANNLDKQNETQQQEEVDRYLRGDTTFCIFTLAAGGTGIDLDQKFEHIRPRTLLSTICYYLEEFAQAYYRDYRISTVSDVYNYGVFFENTIVANHVAPILSKKLKSLNNFSQTGINLEEELIDAVVKGKVKQAPLDINVTPEDIDMSDDTQLVDDEEDDDSDDEKE